MAEAVREEVMKSRRFMVGGIESEREREAFDGGRAGARWLRRGGGKLDSAEVSLVKRVVEGNGGGVAVES